MSRIVVTIVLPASFQAKTTAFVYFMIGNVVLFVSIVTYIIMSKTVFFKYYTVDKLAMSKSSSSVALPSSSTDRSNNGPDFQTVLRKIWVYGLSEWLVFVVTLCIYPSVTVLVTSQNHGNGHPWNGNNQSKIQSSQSAPLFWVEQFFLFQTFTSFQSSIIWFSIRVTIWDEFWLEWSNG